MLQWGTAVSAMTQKLKQTESALNHEGLFQ